MIIIYVGRRGAGKTLSMVKDAVNFQSDGWKIYSNMRSLSFGTYISEEDILRIDKNTELDNCVLMIDELQILFDSRNSMAVANKKFSNFIQQIRKRNIILLCTTQFSNTVELRIRQHLDVQAKPYFDKELDVCEVEYLDITSLEDGELNIISVAYDARDVYGYYNTGERI